MNLQPLNDRILVRVDPPETKTTGGLLLPDDARKAKNSGVVIAVGPGKVNEQGVRVPVGLKVGDHILFKGYAVEPIADYDADKLMMEEKAVIAVIADSPYPKGNPIGQVRAELTAVSPTNAAEAMGKAQMLEHLTNIEQFLVVVARRSDPQSDMQPQAGVWEAEANAVRSVNRDPNPEKPEAKPTGLLEPGKAPIPQNAASMESSLTKYADQFKK